MWNQNQPGSCLSRTCFPSLDAIHMSLLRVLIGSLRSLRSVFTTLKWKHAHFHWLTHDHLKSNNGNGFPPKVYERATLQKLWRQMALVQCCPPVVVRCCTWTECDRRWHGISSGVTRFPNSCAFPSKCMAKNRLDKVISEWNIRSFEHEDTKNTQIATKSRSILWRTTVRDGW